MMPRDGGNFTNNVYTLSANIENGVTPSVAAEGLNFGWKDKNGLIIGRINPWFMANGVQRMRYITKRRVGSTDYYAGISVGIDSSGNTGILLEGQNATAAWNTTLGTKSMVKAVRYSQPAGKWSGNKTYTHTMPTGYTLLVNEPLGAYVSGEATSYITDRSTSVSGTTVTVSLYFHNPSGASLTPVYSLLYVKSALA